MEHLILHIFASTEIRGLLSKKYSHDSIQCQIFETKKLFKNWIQHHFCLLPNVREFQSRIFEHISNVNIQHEFNVHWKYIAELFMWIYIWKSGLRVRIMQFRASGNMKIPSNFRVSTISTRQLMAIMHRKKKICICGWIEHKKTSNGIKMFHSNFHKRNCPLTLQHSRSRTSQPPASNVWLVYCAF